ncbi:hypothetical protein [uncultured Clostridium sp.]|uniref:hypothetical protein n=1 Tax=uncultured Clostridium sp. TaxID=59620 RepID=UPI0025EF8B8C|nr:hypothetical protein [uncultured Clostridium sp.]
MDSYILGSIHGQLRSDKLHIRANACTIVLGETSRTAWTDKISRAMLGQGEDSCLILSTIVPGKQVEGKLLGQLNWQLFRS